jgi:hypothetical protein
MLKNIVLALLLANILLLAWKRWVVPPDAEFPDEFAVVAERQLVALNAPGRSPAEQPPEEGRCTRIGPFADVGMADSVGEQLESDAFEVSRMSQAGQIWAGYWVQLVDLKTPDAAARILDRLIVAGLRDAYVFQLKPVINISLGVFRSRKGAERVAGVARNLGLAPEMTDRFQPGVEHWLTVESRGEKALSLSNVKLGATQILRSEAIPCAGGPPVNARIQP